MSFRVALEIFRGPLDLLLYLVRKHELDVMDIPVATIAQQFLEHLDVLQQLDVNAVGEFLEMASMLLEIKSRMALPVGEEEAAEVEDPREELVERLLEYKTFRDAASLLEEQGRAWQEHIPRLANDLPTRRIDPAGQPIQEVELWDLVSAFGRIVRDSRVTHTPSIVYDDTPIHVYMQRIHQRLMQDRRAAFSQLFYPGMHKTAMIGVFLSILELVRHHRVRTEQEDGHGEIWVLPGQVFNASLDLSNVDTYGEKAAADESQEVAKAA